MKHGDSLPEESRGEIVIKGPNVSSGYLGRPDLNGAVFSGERRARLSNRRSREDFVTDYFFSKAGSTTKSSSMAIELNSAISRRTCARFRWFVMPPCCPLSKNGKTQWLAGFVLPRSKFQTTELTPNDHASRTIERRLPDYMLPRKFFVVEAFPLITANGKSTNGSWPNRCDSVRGFHLLRAASLRRSPDAGSRILSAAPTGAGRCCSPQLVRRHSVSVQSRKSARRPEVARNLVGGRIWSLAMDSNARLRGGSRARGLFFSIAIWAVYSFPWHWRK